MTYDEGCEELLDNVLPLHRRYGIPGHVALVAPQVGVRRNVPGSSFDGLMILSREQVHALVAEGWGVSCHSMTHVHTTDENAHHEVVEAKAVLEQALGMSVPSYMVPNNNEGYPPALKVAAAAGYHGIMTIYDEVNPPDVDLLRLCRVPIHSEYPPPFYSVFDPYKRLHQAMDCNGWIIDYAHTPRPGKPICAAKDPTTEELEERFATVCRLGGDDVWLAEPNDVIAWLREQRGLTGEGA
jgi:peptidoglycan/xylan/chitin deacetylase (PgdA/CDA1 family)